MFLREHLWPPLAMELMRLPVGVGGAMGEATAEAASRRTIARRSVLLVDDEEDILELVGRYVAQAGCEVIKTRTGEEALARCVARPPSLVVLDIGIPQLDGIEVCKALKANPKTAPIPIIMLTARSSEVDRILCFELGVDDYLTKPFSPRELVLRINSILRRHTTPAEEPAVLVAGAIKLEGEHCVVTSGGRPVTLTAIEFKLLQALMQQAGRTLTRETLLVNIWGGETDVGLRAIDTHIRRLRDKLGRAGEQIVTVRSFGYRLEET